MNELWRFFIMASGTGIKGIRNVGLYRKTVRRYDVQVLRWGYASGTLSG